MDIKNVSEFAQYCQQHADDESLPEMVALADRWTDLSIRLGRQYGGFDQGIDTWVGEAYRRMTDAGLNLTQDQLLKTHEVVTRFWEHGKAFDEWFQSKVVVAQR